ncbi:FkbM family methyltransferase [Mucilaginibacter dorajii]|uniref:Methyltransferase FkbM domain-containing protein n=1 Tax=Mucilaginibacter dorajii TaxID=692994 RepID=A0ABP7Q2H1_9SPHI|nr:FkbM family methyltransferase [Mucilaginibacter dorajii]
MSNTYLFYLAGSTGVNIEPDPELIESFIKCRPNDVNINIGIGLEAEDVLDFYVMSNRVLNTFSKEEAERVAAYGSYGIETIKKIKVIPLQKIVETYFLVGTSPDFISIDVEGLDYQILKTLDLTKYTTTVFCIETINYTEDNSEKKNEAIFKYFTKNNFFVYADTYINTIFINKDYWNNRGTA